MELHVHDWRYLSSQFKAYMHVIVTLPTPHKSLTIEWDFELHHPRFAIVSCEDV